LDWATVLKESYHENISELKLGWVVLRRARIAELKEPAAERLT
jgi:hypothetical protein